MRRRRIPERVGDDQSRTMVWIPGEMPLCQIDVLSVEETADQREIAVAPHEVAIEQPRELAMVVQGNVVVVRNQALVLREIDRTDHGIRLDEEAIEDALGKVASFAIERNPLRQCPQLGLLFPAFQIPQGIRELFAVIDEIILELVRGSP